MKLILRVILQNWTSLENPTLLMGLGILEKGISWKDDKLQF